ncbi:DUF6777 domain-containing protein [Streptomyces sp. NPDC059928]|uniref:DUF6777 domain-containing protein n=1 Tax=unclassified Streptomyces TaxID=2593676 RepID=UPI003649CD40
MPSTLRRCAAAAAVLSFAAFAAGCGGGASSADDQQDLDLQPIAAAGPDPFTQSTAESTATPTPSAPPGSRSSAPTPGLQTTRTVSGAAPGLYGGTQSVASCDVEKQITFLVGDRTKERAFADAAGIDPAAIPTFLRGLTPVVLRVDTRVTNHGFRGGAATSFQSVLQAGTAVLVDDHGEPRVRCACGNPLKPPNAHQGNWTNKGKPWPGYRPSQVTVIRPTTVVINSLVIVNITNNTWIERPTGDDGQHDRRRPDITIDPKKPPVPEPPSPSPSSSPHVSSSPPSPSPQCPSPAPTVTVTETPTASQPPRSGPPLALPRSPEPPPSNCPTATRTVTASPSAPVAGPSTPSPATPATPSTPAPPQPPDGGTSAQPSPSTGVPSGPPSEPDSGVVGPSPDTENV